MEELKEAGNTEGPQRAPERSWKHSNTAHGHRSETPGDNWAVSSQGQSGPVLCLDLLGQPLLQELLLWPMSQPRPLPEP